MPRKTTFSYGLHLPNLPKPLYLWLKEFTRTHHISQVQAILCGILLLQALETGGTLTTERYPVGLTIDHLLDIARNMV